MVDAFDRMLELQRRSVVLVQRFGDDEFGLVPAEELLRIIPDGKLALLEAPEFSKRLGEMRLKLLNLLEKDSVYCH